MAMVASFLELLTKLLILDCTLYQKKSLLRGNFKNEFKEQMKHENYAISAKRLELQT